MNDSRKGDWVALVAIYLAIAAPVYFLYPQLTKDNGAPVAARTTLLPPGNAQGLHYALGPANGAQVAFDWVMRHGFMTRPFEAHSAKPGDIAIAPPLSAYTVNGLADRAPTERFEVPGPAPVFSDYQYGIYLHGEPASTVIVHDDAATGQVKAEGSKEGSRLASLRAFESLTNVGRVAAGVYEARLLSFNWTGSGSPEMVLWLASAPGGSDLIYPMDTPVHTLIHPHTLYTVADFVKMLHAGTVGTVAGMVVGEDGKPVPQAAVTVSYGIRSWQGATDNAGAFSIGEISPGLPLNVTAVVNEASGLQQIGALTPGAVTPLPAPLVVGRPMSISGAFVDAAGRPAAGATIAYIPLGISSEGNDVGLLADAINAGGIPAGTTDTAGAFKVQGLPAGLYSVTAVLDPKDGGALQYGSAQVVGGHAGDDLTLVRPIRLVPGGAISTMVYDVNGLPAAGARVVVIKTSGRQEIRRTTTDTNGALNVRDLSPGTYQLSVSFSRNQTEDVPDIEVGAGIVTKLAFPVDLQPSASPLLGN